MNEYYSNIWFHISQSVLYFFRLTTEKISKKQTEQTNAELGTGFTTKGQPKNRYPQHLSLYEK